MMYSQFIENPVRKFAKHGLDEAVDSPENQRKWLLNWSVGLATELDELLTAIETNQYYGLILTELGDIMFYYAVQRLLLTPSNTVVFIAYQYQENATDEKKRDAIIFAMRLALRRLDSVKKFSRDNAVIDAEKIGYLLDTADQIMAVVLPCFHHDDLATALELCFIKLNGRHGEKYDPEKSRARYE